MTRFRERIDDVGWTFSVMFNEFMKFNIVGIVNSSFALLLYELLFWIDISIKRHQTSDLFLLAMPWRLEKIFGLFSTHPSFRGLISSS